MMDKIYKRTTILAIVLTLSVGGALSGTTVEDEMMLDPLGDSITIGVGLSSVILSEILLSRTSPRSITLPPINLVNPIDRQAILPFSQPLDIASDISQYLAFLSPAVLAIGTGFTDWIDIGVLYVEVAAIAWGSKNLLKLAISRYRPFLYDENVPVELIEDGDYANSFPSGHSTMAFAGAAYTSYMVAHYHPDSPWSIPVAIGSYGVAAATAVLRVLSGNHYVTDVVAGAAIGTAIGIIVPLLHRRPRQDG